MQGMRPTRGFHAHCPATWSALPVGLSMMSDAADLMLEAWYWMPAGLLLDLTIYHFLVRWIDFRG